jgi:quercetin dioxygenase-like cupin family protein
MSNRIPLFVLSLFYFVVFTAISSNAQSITDVSKNSKVVLDNEKVHVVDFVSNPGEKNAMHSHPDYLIYVIEGGTTKATSKDGKIETLVFKKGQTIWRNATTHVTENVGKTKIHLLLVEFKK